MASLPTRSRRTPPPRPGALLAAAAAVPLGAAVLYAAGLLDWLPRLALGAAVVVLGVAVRRTEDTATGARIGPRASRAIGLAMVVGGALIVGGALTAAVVAGDSDAEAAPLLLCAALAVAGAWVARASPQVGGVAVAVAASVAWFLVLVLLDVGGELEIALTVVPAAGLAAAAVRGAGSAAVRAGLGTAAALLILPGSGEIFGFSVVLWGLIESSGSSDPAIGWTIAQTVVGQLVLATLLATAFVRRDPVGGALAAAVLMTPPFSFPFLDSGDTALRIAHGLLPVLAVTTLGVAIRSRPLRGWLTARAPTALRQAGWTVSVDGARGAWAVALVVAVANLWSADSRAVAALAVVALLVAAATAWSTRGPAATVAAAVTLVGWAVVQPVRTVIADVSRSVDENGVEVSSGLVGATTGSIVELVVIAVVALALLARVGTPGVAAAGAYAVITAGAAAVLLELASDGQLLRIVLGSLVPPAVLLVIAAGVAAVGPSRWRPHAQAVAATAAGAGVVVLFALPTGVLQSVFLDDGKGIPDDVRLVLVVTLVGIAFGGALLAVSTTRRSSPVAALGAVAAAVATAILAATLSAALVWPPESSGPVDTELDLFVPLAPVLGFEWRGGLLQFAEPGWPVIFGLVGAVLLGAGAWLESRRPVPAGAPVAPSDRG